MATVQITLPDALAREAAHEGLLEPSVIEALLRERLALARVDRMQAVRATVTVPPLLPMTASEVEAEVAAYRAERRRAAGT